MGLVSVVLVAHDALGCIEGDSGFGKKLQEAVIVGANSGGRQKPDVSAQGEGRGTYINAASYVTTFRTNDNGVVLIEEGVAKSLRYEEAAHLRRLLERFRRKKEKEKSK